MGPEVKTSVAGNVPMQPAKTTLKLVEVTIGEDFQEPEGYLVKDIVDFGGKPHALLVKRLTQEELDAITREQIEARNRAVQRAREDMTAAPSPDAVTQPIEATEAPATQE